MTTHATKTITFDRFCELLTVVHAIDVDGCLIYSPYDCDDEINITVNDDKGNEETYVIKAIDNESIDVTVDGVCHLTDELGESHAIGLLTMSTIALG